MGPETSMTALRGPVGSAATVLSAAASKAVTPHTHTPNHHKIYKGPAQLPGAELFLPRVPQQKTARAPP